jgi:hypothetical protein
MGGGRSGASTSNTASTTNTQDIDTTTVGLDNIQEGAIGLGQVGGAVSITQISTDQGSVEAGRRIGEASLDFADEFGGNAFDFGSDALSTVEHGLSETLDFGSDTVAGAFDFGKDAIKSVQQTAESSTSELGRAITSAAEASRSDTTVAFQNIIKYVAIAGAIGLVAYFVFGRK